MEVRFGILSTGNKNQITDVPGVLVGHKTLSDGPVQTGVTAILPHGGDLFHEKCIAACHVINGFGKSAGLMQVQELGSLETPILMTNTLSVGTAFTACVRYMLCRNPRLGLSESTVNPVVTECNDGYLNDIRGLHVTERDVLDAIDAAGPDFALGAVGAGRGMSCYRQKGGIGSASRVCEIAGRFFTVGALLLTNFGSAADLIIAGEPVGRRIADRPETAKGSCIMVLATDAPLSSRQLGRCCRRAQNGLARTGSMTENGSGEVALMFTTANRLTGAPFQAGEMISDAFLDPVFRAVTECVEESVVRSLLEAETVIGRDGHTRQALKERLQNAT